MSKLVRGAALASVVACAVVVACGSGGSGSGSGDTPAPPAATKNALCTNGKPTSPYPPGPYLMQLDSTLPPGLVFEGADGPVSFDALYEPCAARSRVVVVRVSGAWCGSCQWHAAHTKAFLDDPRWADRLLLVDVLVGDRDNVVPDRDALVEWRSSVDAPAARVNVASDPHDTFGPVLTALSPLPEYLFIDTRTMKILRVASDPDQGTLLARISAALSDTDGSPRIETATETETPPLVDGLFDPERIDMIRAMKWTGAPPPPDPTNAYGDLPAAVALGRQLFEDKLLSPSGKVSCTKCHDETLALGDGAAQSEGVAKVDRNSPGIALSAHARWQFWDGRADTLWMQALGPFEDAREFGSSRLFVAHRIATTYAVSYGAIFGAQYPLDGAALAALPPSGKPGDSTYDALSADDKDKVTRVFVNVGKAIAAFERALNVKPNALDAYAGGDLAALTTPQKHALHDFFQNGCAQCHWGPRLTDDAFHSLRFPTGRQDQAPDRGRIDGLTKLAAGEFLASSKWSDAPAAAKKIPTDTSGMLGAFKTPTLRGLTTSAPFGHGGTLADLPSVSAHYSTRGISDVDPRAVGRTEDWVPMFDTNAVVLLPAFLDVLSAPVVFP